MVYGKEPDNGEGSDGAERRKEEECPGCEEEGDVGEEGEDKRDSNLCRGKRPGRAMRETEVSE